MNVAIFGKNLSGNDVRYVQSLMEKLNADDGEIYIYAPFLSALSGMISFSRQPKVFSTKADISGNVDYLFSIGGDGTLLDTITLVGDSGIPIIGINIGRLGFLSGISKDDIIPALDEILEKKYIIEERTLLRLVTPTHLFGDFNFALNDLTVYKRNPLSMLVIRTYINDEFLNTYWADGLIVATPTGSTAYSLSCTGPIITPDSENFVITPIASHNLTVRPIVVRDNSIIRIVVEGRNLDCVIGLDSRIQRIETAIEMQIMKETFKINLLRLTNQNFFKTIREKLNWGLDIRN